MTLAVASLPRPRDVLGSFGLYIHIPFCAHRCWYCDFNAYAGLDQPIEAYMRALVRDVSEALSAPAGSDLSSRPVVTSVFIGGGTPSLVGAGHIEGLLQAVRQSWPLAPGAEVTIECNPESVDADKLDGYLGAGVNRISLGVQSLDDDLLPRLGRTHDASTAIRALRAARRAGFEEVNADLIFGIPGEDPTAWERSLEGVLECGPTHVSCYALTYEEGTPLHAWKRIGRVVPVPDDEVASRWELADERLHGAGMERYEISNWALPGSSCRHNDLYWTCGEYLGLGAGAHSHVAAGAGSVRSWTVKAPERYIRMVGDAQRPVAGGEEIDKEVRAAEAMMLGLRRSAGVSASAFSALVGAELTDVFADELAEGIARGLLEWDDSAVRLTRPLVGDAAAILFA